MGNIFIVFFYRCYHVAFHDLHVIDVVLQEEIGGAHVVDERERLEIESHVEQTYRFLTQIPWTEDLRNVAEIAYGHHEKLDGRGYPDGVAGDAIPIEARDPRFNLANTKALLDELKADKVSLIGHSTGGGEVARYVNAEYNVGADLRVVPAAGWRSSAWFDQTGLPWVNPSPNIRSLEAALNYSGLVLFEATNLTVGRGTDRPSPEVAKSQSTRTIRLAVPRRRARPRQSRRGARRRAFRRVRRGRARHLNGFLLGRSRHFLVFLVLHRKNS